MLWQPHARHRGLYAWLRAATSPVDRLDHDRCRQVPSARCADGAQLPAISCLGAFSTPAVGARGELHHAGVRERCTGASIATVPRSVSPYLSYGHSTALCRTSAALPPPTLSLRCRPSTARTANPDAIGQLAVVVLRCSATSVRASGRAKGKLWQAALFLLEAR